VLDHTTATPASAHNNTSKTPQHSIAISFSYQNNHSCTNTIGDYTAHATATPAGAQTTHQQVPGAYTTAAPTGTYTAATLACYFIQLLLITFNFTIEIQAFPFTAPNRKSIIDSSILVGEGNLTSFRMQTCTL